MTEVKKCLDEQVFVIDKYKDKTDLFKIFNMSELQ